MTFISNFDFSTLKTFWIHLTTHILPGPCSFSYFLPLIILPASLFFPPRILPKPALTWIVFPCSLACSLHAMLAMRGPDVISMDMVWWGMYLLVWKDVRNGEMGFGRVMLRSKGKKQEEEEAEAEVWRYPESRGGLTERAMWIAVLLSERPLTSWKTGEKSVHDNERVLPPCVVRSRRKFVKDLLVVLLPAAFFWMPLALQLRASERYFPPWTGLGSADTEDFVPFPLPSPSRFSIPLFLHGHIPVFLLRPLTMAMYMYALLILHFLPSYLYGVLGSFLLNPWFGGGASHTWSPHLWPRTHFGPFSAVLDEGLRGLWGKWWHQQMRHAVAEPGRALARLLGLRRGGLARYAVICGSAFLLSGLTHMGLVPPEPQGDKGFGAWELRLRMAAFFWVQPVGMLVEIVVVERALRIVKRLLRPYPLAKVVERGLRVCWVLLFMSFALRLLIVPFQELGFWKIWPPFFLDVRTKSLLRGDWMM